MCNNILPKSFGNYLVQVFACMILNKRNCSFANLSS